MRFENGVRERELKSLFGGKGKRTLARSRSGHDAVARGDDEVASDHRLGQARVFEAVDLGEGNDANDGMISPSPKQPYQVGNHKIKDNSLLSNLVVSRKSDRILQINTP